MEQAARRLGETVNVQSKPSIRWFAAYLCFHAAVVFATVPFAFPRAESIVVQLRLNSAFELIAAVGFLLTPLFAAMFVYMVVRMIHGIPELLWRIVVPDGVLFAVHFVAFIRAIQ
jgi:hypothetical protein